MFLRNYDNWMLALMGAAHTKGYTTGSGTGYLFHDSGWQLSTQYNTNVGNADNAGDGYINFRTTSGALKNISGSVASVSGGVMCPTAMGAYGICLGNGDTTVTYEDYRLSGEVVFANSLLALVSTEVTFNATKKCFTRTTIYTYTNTGDSDITIKEWGLYNNTGTSTVAKDFSNSSANMVLMFREVLNTPITIAAGTTGTLTFSIDMPMPNHP